MMNRESDLVTFSFDDFDTYECINLRPNRGRKGSTISGPETSAGSGLEEKQNAQFNVQKIIDQLTTATVTKAKKQRADNIKKNRRESLKAQMKVKADANPFGGNLARRVSSQDVSKKQAPSVRSQSKLQDIKQETSGMVDPINENSFDPEMLKQTFEQSIHQLLQLREQTDNRINTLISDAEEADRIHKRNLAKLNTHLNFMYEKFRNLDKNISTVSHTAVRIGSKLENVDTLKSLDMKGRLLLGHLLQFNKGPEFIPEIYPTKYRTEEIEGQATISRLSEAASLIQQLYMIAEDAQFDKLNTARDLITKVSEDIEGQLLFAFDNSIKYKNIDDMKQCALMLLDFPGRRVIQRYHNSFRVLCKPVWQGLQEIDTATRQNYSEKYREEITKAYQTIIDVCSKECVTMSHVFPNLIEIFHIILERLFDEDLTAFVEQSCQQIDNSPALHRDSTKGSRRSSEDDMLKERIIGASKMADKIEKHLVCCQITYLHTNQLITSLLSIPMNLPESGPLKHQSNKDNNTGDDHNTTSNVNLNSNSTSVSMGNINSQDVLSGLFQTYRQQYCSREKERLKHLYYAELSGRLSQMAQKNSAMDEKTLFGKRTNNAREYMQGYVMDVLNTDIVERLLSDSSAVVRRAVTFIDETDQISCLHMLFSILFNELMDNYFHKLISIGLEIMSVEKSMGNDSNNYNESNTNVSFFLTLIKKISVQINQVQNHYNQFIRPILSSDSNIQTIWESRMRDAIHNLQTRILDGLSLCLAYSVKIINRLLSKQKPAYYRPLDMMELEDSNAVTISVSEYVREHTAMIKDSIFGGNGVSYLNVFGMRLYDSISDHFCKLKVNSLGGMLMLQDAKVYENLLQELNATSSLQKVADMRLLSNVLLPPTEVAVMTIRSMFFGELKLNKMDINEVYKWIRMRSDYSDIKNKLFAQIPQLQQASNANSNLSWEIKSLKIGGKK